MDDDSAGQPNQEARSGHEGARPDDTCQVCRGQGELVQLFLQVAKVTMAETGRGALSDTDVTHYRTHDFAFGLCPQCLEQTREQWQRLGRVNWGKYLSVLVLGAVAFGFLFLLESVGLFLVSIPLVFAGPVVFAILEKSCQQRLLRFLGIEMNRYGELITILTTSAAEFSELTLRQQRL